MQTRKHIRVAMVTLVVSLTQTSAELVPKPLNAQDPHTAMKSPMVKPRRLADTLVFGSGNRTAPQDEPISQKELRVFRGHRDAVLSIAVSPDGKTLASASSDQTIRLWDLATGQAGHLLEGHTAYVYSVAFSPSGKILASGSWDQTIRLWDVVTGKPLRQLKGHKSVVYSLAFSPDAQTLVSGSYDQTVKLWNVATGQTVATLQEHDGWVYTVAFSSDGKTVASSGADQTVKLWDATSGQRRVTLKGHADEVLTLAFSGDGKILASAGRDRIIRLWEVISGKERLTLPGHDHAVCSLAFSPDGKMLATGGQDRTIRLWEVATGRQRHRFSGYFGTVHSLTFAPGGNTLVSGNSDALIRFWNATEPQSDRPAESLRLSHAQQQALWTDLASTDAIKAHQAIGTLLAAPQQAVICLEEYLRPAPPFDPKIAQLIADLDDDTFAIRENASAELEKVKELVEPALRLALEEKPSLEVRLRVEKLLGKLEGVIPSPEQLRVTRGIEVLEHIGTVEARKLLDGLAQGGKDARLTQEARGALKRLAGRSAGPP